jgi:hypothetical protein
VAPENSAKADVLGLLSDSPPRPTASTASRPTTSAYQPSSFTPAPRDEPVSAYQPSSFSTQAPRDDPLSPPGGALAGMFGSAPAMDLPSDLGFTPSILDGPNDGARKRRTLGAARGVRLPLHI